MERVWVRIGTVRSVNSGRRELRIQPDADHAHALEGLAWLHLQPRGAAVKRCKVVSLTEMGGNWRAVLSPGVPREWMDALVKAAVLLDEAEYEPEDRELYVRDLEGMKVFDADGETIGTVTEIYEGAANAAFTVEKTNGGTLTLPMIEQVFLDIDGERGEIRLGDIAPYVVDSDAD